MRRGFFNQFLLENNMHEFTPSNSAKEADNISQSAPHIVVKPNLKLLSIIVTISFILLTVLMVFSGRQPVLALDEQKLLVIEQAQIEVTKIAIEDHYLKPRVVFGQLGSIQQANIGFELVGTLLEVVVKEGALVEKGQVLAKIDTARLDSRKNELLSALASANANAKLAQLSSKRVTQLVSKNLEPQQRLDEVQAQLDAANANVNEAKARLKTIQVELAKSVLLAPFDGQVVKQFVDPGTVLNSGQAVFSILAQNALEARMGLPEQTAFGLQVGQTHELAINSQTFTAQVSSVAKQRNSATRTVETVFTIDPSSLSAKQKALMVAGDLVSLTVDIPIATRGAWVPITALASAVRGFWTLYVVSDDNTIQTRLVSIEYADNNKAFVSGAIETLDKVVVAGIHRLVPKQKVTNVRQIANELATTKAPNANILAGAETSALPKSLARP